MELSTKQPAPNFNQCPTSQRYVVNRAFTTHYTTVEAYSLKELAET